MSQLSTDEAAGGTTYLYFALMMSFSGNAKTSGTILGVQVMLGGIDGELRCYNKYISLVCGGIGGAEPTSSEETCPTIVVKVII